MWTVLTTAVFAVAIFRGQDGLTAVELMLIAIAGVGIVGWLVSGEPIVATACVVAADLIAVACSSTTGERSSRRSR